MRFINQLVAYAPNPIQMLAELDRSSLTKVLHLYLSTKITEEFQQLIVQYQNRKFEAMEKEKDIPFDPRNPGSPLTNSPPPEHEQMLLDLWSSTFPNEKLTGRISAQWGKLGFQGTDPATDFR